MKNIIYGLVFLLAFFVANTASAQVNSVPSCNFVAEPTSVAPGQEFVLNWTTQNAVSAEISYGQNNVIPVSPNGSLTVNTNPGWVTTTYTLTVYGDNGLSDDCVVTVSSTAAVPACLSFTATPTVFTVRGTNAYTLTWTTQNTTVASIDQGIGVVKPYGSVQVSPTETTTYTLSVFAEGRGAALSCSVTVPVGSSFPLGTSYEATFNETDEGITVAGSSAIPAGMLSNEEGQAVLSDTVEDELEQGFISETASDEPGQGVNSDDSSNKSRFIPCEGKSCSACDLVKMANTIIVWLFGIIFLLFAVLMMVAGFGLVTSGGNPSAMQRAKDKFSNALIGLLIVMSAWLIVDTMMKGLVKNGGELKGWGPWSEVECQVQTPTKTPVATPGGGGVTPVDPVDPVVGGDPRCPTCIPISAPNISCKTSSSCTIVPSYNAKLQNITSSMQITEAFPPTRTHQNACHANGTCTDIVFSDRNFTLERIVNFQNEARAAGFRAVFEPAASFNGGSCTGIPDCQPYSVTRATGSHFSLYQ